MNGHNKKHNLESKFQTEVIKTITNLGGYCVKVHVASYQTQGTPDVLCCYRGMFIAFELKLPGEKPSELQLWRIKRIKKAGGIALVADAICTIEETLYEITRIQQSGESKQ